MPRRWLALGFVLVGCRAKADSPALLGTKTDAVVKQLEASCTGHTRTDSVEANGFRSEWIECSLPEHEGYTVTFDQKDRISKIEISGSKEQALATFDQSIAPIVPQDVRQKMRDSVATADPAVFATKPGPCIDLVETKADWPIAGTPRRLTWALDQCVRR